MQTKKLIKYRKAAKLSQSDVARKLGCTAAAVNQYEKGKRTPAIDVLVNPKSETGRYSYIRC